MGEMETGKSVNVAARITAEEAADLAARAKADERSISQTIRRAIRAYLAGEGEK